MKFSKPFVTLIAVGLGGCVHTNTQPLAPNVVRASSAIAPTDGMVYVPAAIAATVEAQVKEAVSSTSIERVVADAVAQEISRLRMDIAGRVREKIEREAAEAGRGRLCARCRRKGPQDGDEREARDGGDGPTALCVARAAEEKARGVLQRAAEEDFAREAGRRERERHHRHHHRRAGEQHADEPRDEPCRCADLQQQHEDGRNPEEQHEEIELLADDVGLVGEHEAFEFSRQRRLDAARIKIRGCRKWQCNPGIYSISNAANYPLNYLLYQCYLEIK